MTPGPKILFFGRSNVGKSSLINTLLEQRLAKTSSTPGKTLSINYYLIDRQAAVRRPARATDSPRSPRAKALRVRQLIVDFLDRVENVRLAALLIDSRRGFLPPDLDTLAQIVEKKFPDLDNPDQE